ncbi:MAG: hypothetical protein KF860_07990 [Cyclobacteriaceae bacterium]|nr:hypothetical protein [Cyclobacteriaceae bacterium]
MKKSKASKAIRDPLYAIITIPSAANNLFTSSRFLSINNSGIKAAIAAAKSLSIQKKIFIVPKYSVFGNSNSVTY